MASLVNLEVAEAYPTNFGIQVEDIALAQIVLSAFISVHQRPLIWAADGHSTGMREN